jgi:beta-N-acetylhexosaminidase
MTPLDRQIDHMTPEERVGQLMIVGITGQHPSPELEKRLAAEHPGGVVLYADNFGSVAEIRALTASIRNIGAIPPFVAIDQEGGVVRRIESAVPLVPSNMALGATRSADLARRAGADVGAALHRLGFTMNFAPVLDVLSPSGALETRAFSDDPALVALLGAAYAEGLQSAGVVAVGKHFPGAGAAKEDTHRELPVLQTTAQELNARDLVPFRRAMQSNLGGVITAHVALPRITDAADLPATLSPAVMTRVLRDELHFEGVAISDALQMKSLARRGSPGTLAIAAIAAGCDMVLALGGNAERAEVAAALRTAYRNGTLSEARVRQSLRRILALKARQTTARQSIVSGTLERDIARRAITIIGDAHAVADIVRQPLVYVGPAGVIPQSLHAAHDILLPPRIDSASAARLAAELQTVLANTTSIIAVAQTDDQWKFLRDHAATARDHRLVYVNLGSPERTIPASTMVILTYSSSPQSEAAVADVLHGIIPAPGVLPVRGDPVRP